MEKEKLKRYNTLATFRERKIVTENANLRHLNSDYYCNPSKFCACSRLVQKNMKVLVLLPSNQIKSNMFISDNKVHNYNYNTVFLISSNESKVHVYVNFVTSHVILCMLLCANLTKELLSVT